MKKLVRNIALLLLPILLYFGMFVALEPNNYFGLRATTPSGAIFGALRAFENDPAASIIIGDSRTAHFNMQAAEQYAGRRFGNLSFGGAGLQEQLDLLDWWLEEYPDITEVTFMLSFYTLNANYGMDRIPGVKQALHNPLAYMTNLSFNITTVQTLFDWLAGRPLYGGDAETEDPANYTYTDFTVPVTGEVVRLRTTVAQHLTNLSGYMPGWRVNEAEFARLLATIAACEARGIRFTVVLPPIHPAVLAYIMQPYGIDQKMQPVLAQLHASGATILDYELTNTPFTDDSLFYDGFHLDTRPEAGLDQWTEMLFTALR